jgi:hypothetical protein
MYTESPSESVKFLFWNAAYSYEMDIREIVFDSWNNPECTMFLASKYDAVFEKYHLLQLAGFINRRECIGGYEFNPDVVVRRDEHGVLLGGANWKRFVETCQKTHPTLRRMSYDYGYFAHYRSYMADIEDVDGRSSIICDWPLLSGTVDWGTAPAYIQTYAKQFLEKLDAAKNLPPIAGLPAGRYVVIWPQQSLDLLRQEFLPEIAGGDAGVMTSWLKRLITEIERLGLVPVVKTGPTMHFSRGLRLGDVAPYARIFVSTEKEAQHHAGVAFEPVVAPKLIAHAAFHVVCCSSVTNLLTLAGVPVVAMGRSWFNGLGVFSEPISWESIFHRATDVCGKSRAKWINWWLTRQCERKDIGAKLLQVYRSHKNCHDFN